MHGYKQELGRKGEQLARNFLRRQGYKIIAQNFSCRFGEIDIIAQQDKATVFIEVRTRSNAKFGLPEESIQKSKLRHLIAAARVYIKKQALPEGKFRFHIVSIIFADKTKIRLIKDIL